MLHFPRRPPRSALALLLAAGLFTAEAVAPAWAQEKDEVPRDAATNVLQPNGEKIRQLRKDEFSPRTDGQTFPFSPPVYGQVAQVSKNDTVSLVSRYGEGSSLSADVQDSLVYFANGSYLEIADISDPTSPIERGRVLLPSQVQDVAVAGDYAYVADGTGGMRIVDVSTPTDPQEVSAIGVSIFSGNAVTGVAVREKYAYFSSENSGLQVLDVSNPSAPQAVGAFKSDSPSGITGEVAVAGEHVYIADYEEGLRVIDVSDPNNPQQVTVYKTADDDALDVTVTGNYAYVANGQHGFYILDVSDPNNPQPIVEIPFASASVATEGSYAYFVGTSHNISIFEVSDPADIEEIGYFEGLSDFQRTYEDFHGEIEVAGNHAYVAGGARGLHLIDASTPESLEEVSRITTGGPVTDIAVDSNYAYEANGRVIDVSNPADPQRVSLFAPSSSGEAIAKANDHVYSARGRDGFYVDDVSDPSNPNRVARTDYGLFVNDVNIAQSYAYMVGVLAPEDLSVRDVSNPADIQIVGELEGSGAGSVSVVGDYAYVVNYLDESLRVIDVSSPADPRQVSTLSLDAASFFGGRSDIAVAGGYAYVSQASGLSIIDVSNPENPQKVGDANNYGTFVQAGGVAVANGYAFLAVGLAGLRMIDVSGPTNPEVVSGWDTAGSTRSVTISGNHVYVTGGGTYLTYTPFRGSDGLFVFEFTGDDTPAPAITSVEPDSITGSNEPQPLTINGSGFRPKSSVKLRNKRTGEVFPDRETSEQTSTEITVNPVFGTADATWSVEVINPGADDSEEFEFEVKAPRPATLTYDISRDFDGADETTDYRLVALPGAEEVPLSGVVDGQAGTGWTAYRQGENGDGLVSYRDSAPEDFVFAPGAGFWVLATDGMARNAEVPVPELDGNDTYTYPLHAGWNIVSNPLETDLAWSAVQDASGGASQPLWSFAGGSYEQVQTFASAARGGEAFYFYNAEGLDELVLPYAPDPSSSASSESAAALARGEASGDSPAWSLALTASRKAPSSRADSASETLHATVRAGVAKQAKTGFDAGDAFAPPGRFEAVSLRFLPTGFEQKGVELASEYRPADAGKDGQRFQLALRSTPGRPVTLRADLPKVASAKASDRKAVLVRERTGKRFALSEEKPVRLTPQAKEEQLTLLVGSNSFIEAAAEKATPAESKLIGTYPNPFRSEATIAYALADESDVQLTVYDMLGRKVRTLVDERQSAGRKKATLQARSLASGVYLFRLRIGDRLETGRLVHVH